MYFDSLELAGGGCVNLSGTATIGGSTGPMTAGSSRQFPTTTSLTGTTPYTYVWSTNSSFATITAGQGTLTPTMTISGSTTGGTVVLTLTVSNCGSATVVKTKSLNTTAGT